MYDSSVRAQSERNQKIRNEPEALPAAHCTNIFQHCLATFRCIALHWIAFSLRCIALDCNANQCSEVGHRWPTCNAALHCDIAMQHCIAAWHCSCMVACLLACLIARLLVIALHSRPKFAGGSPVTLLQMQHCSATLQCSIALQHWMTTWDCNIALQNRTAACLCGTALQHCIAALRSP